MEECTLRSCVDRFNNRRYLSGQAYLNAKNVLPNSHILTNTNNTNIQVSVSQPANISNQQMNFAANSVGTVGGVNSNGGNCLNTTNGLSNNFISQTNNTNGQQSDLNEPYDNNGLLDFAVSSHYLNGSQDKNAYNNGYSWDLGDVDLSEDFKKHYEIWLQKEVFNIRIDWDSLRTVYDIEVDNSNKTNASEPTDTHKLDVKT